MKTRMFFGNRVSTTTPVIRNILGERKRGFGERKLRGGEATRMGLKMLNIKINKNLRKIKTKQRRPLESILQSRGL